MRKGVRIALLGIPALEAFYAGEANPASHYRTREYVEGLATERRRLLRQYFLFYFGSLLTAYVLNVSGSWQGLKVSAFGVEVEKFATSPDLLLILLSLLYAYSWMRFASVMALTIMINTLGARRDGISGEIFVAAKDAQLLWTDFGAINVGPERRVAIPRTWKSAIMGVYTPIPTTFVVLQIGFVWYSAIVFFFNPQIVIPNAMLFFLDFFAGTLIVITPVFAYAALLLPIPIDVRIPGQEEDR
ncbi:MAG: hypothetical protein GC190_05815 [Alphaproteobacteria bacterium]|nr:hypothetical protein [Alphaproteobacteria bacterium]